MSTGPLAQSKRIGQDVEFLTVSAVDGLRHAEDPETWFDAVTTGVLDAGSADRLELSSTPLAEPGQRVEIKSCQHAVANGDRDDRPGYWFFKGSQHARLLDDGALYLLVVYSGAGENRHIERMVLIPATIVDSLLVGRWYERPDRDCDVAQLPWDAVLQEGQNGE